MCARGCSAAEQPELIGDIGELVGSSQQSS